MIDQTLKNIRILSEIFFPLKSQWTTPLQEKKDEMTIPIITKEIRSGFFLRKWKEINYKTMYDEEIQIHLIDVST